MKLSKELKQRIAQVVSGSGRTAHSPIVEAIEQAALRAELRRCFGEKAEARAKNRPESR